MTRHDREGVLFITRHDREGVLGEQPSRCRSSNHRSLPVAARFGAGTLPSGRVSFRMGNTPFRSCLVSEGNAPFRSRLVHHRVSSGASCRWWGVDEARPGGSAWGVTIAMVVVAPRFAGGPRGGAGERSLPVASCYGGERFLPVAARTHL